MRAIDLNTSQNVANTNDPISNDTLTTSFELEKVHSSGNTYASNMANKNETTNRNANNAGFIIRFFAAKLDRMLFSVLFSLPLLFIVFQAKSSGIPNSFDDYLGIIVYIVVVLFLLLPITVTYNVLMTSKFGGHLGKLLFGLKVLDYKTDQLLDHKTVLYRILPGYMFSAAFFGLGYLRVFKNPENLAWHDELFGTKVVRSGPWFGGLLAYFFVLVYWGFFIFSIVSLLVQNIPLAY